MYIREREKGRENEEKINNLRTTKYIYIYIDGPKGKRNRNI
jgi:hypothetical protein